MTTLVPRSDIERLVQRRRHQTAHIARRVGDVQPEKHAKPEGGLL